MKTEEDQSARPRAYRVGDLVLDIEREWVMRGQQEVALPKLSFDLLLALVRRAPAVVSVQKLMDEVWPTVIVGPETVSQRVKLLRAALDDDAGQPRYISVVRGRGYRVVATVTPLVGVPPTTVPSASTADPIAFGSEAPVPRAGRLHRSRTLVWAAALVVLLAASSTWLFLRPHSVASDTAPVIRDLKIAVLPLENLSPDPSDAFFAAGMHEEIISALAQLADLDVVSRTTMLTYGSRPPKPVSAIAAESGATHIMEGSVRREAQHVRLSLQLIDAAADQHIWSRTYDRTLNSALALQSEIAADVATQLAVRLPVGRASVKAPTNNPEAYDLYLQGLLARSGAVMMFSTTEALRAVEAPLSQAVALDPEFAPAQAELAMAHVITFANNIDPSEQRLQRARRALEKAEHVAPGDPKVLAARGAHSLLIENDAVAALKALHAARAAGLSDPLWLQLIPDVLVSLGRVDEGIDASQRSLALDPRSSSLVTLHAIRLANLRRPVEAIRTLDRAIPELPEMIVLPILREQIYFWHTGEMEPFKAQVARDGYKVGFTPTTAVDDAEALRREAELLRYAGQLRELKTLLDTYAHTRFRSRYIGAGDEPLAEMRGWANLLVGDRAGAAEAGNAVRRFLAETNETQWSAAYRRLLVAEAHLFSGEREPAVAAARAALAAQPWQQCANGCGVLMGSALAAVFAWSGAEEEAMRVLNELATHLPGPGPALLGNDPLFTIPLRRSARFQALVSHLETRMRETRSAVGPGRTSAVTAE
jgi:TolB-like protein/DNA-binding winged helix-turn-helix (wHTH) protein